MRYAASLAAMVLLAACGGEEPVPSRPNWVDDVEPILRGNCFHCHGAGTRPISANRWDVFDPNEAQYKAMGFDATVLNDLGFVSLNMGPPQGGKDHANLKNPINYPVPLRMPPAPALPLSDRDRKVIEKWADTPAADRPRGMRSRNRRPTAVWIENGKSFEVRDGDGEQVLGTVSCSGAMAFVTRTGSHTVPRNGQPPCTVRLYDGQEENTVDLK